MRWYLGIDGGGTHTRAVLVDAQGRVRGIGTAGPSNYHNLDIEAAAANLRAAAGEAWAQAGQAFSPAAGAFLGLAGVKSSRDIASMTSAAEGAGLAPAGTITVANDLHNALAGGLDGSPGIALIAGTGSNCLGCDATGTTVMCGGWGWLMGDRGAGFGLAAEGLRVVARAADGCEPPTRLLPAALAFFGLSEPNELLARLYVGTWRPGAVAEFAPVIVRLASEGDAAALRVLEEGANDLAGIVAGTMRQLDFPSGADVVLLGGCVTSGAPYQPLVESAILRACPRARIRQAAHDPLHGAALNALRCAGHKPIPPLIFPSNT
jgi:N-acetylglucosamine kinase-like BadF-type ATPase